MRDKNVLIVPAIALLVWYALFAIAWGAWWPMQGWDNDGRAFWVIGAVWVIGAALMAKFSMMGKDL